MLYWGDKMRDRGKPTVSVKIAPGTAEQIAQNRELLRGVCEKICDGLGGPVRVTLEWGTAQDINSRPPLKDSVKRESHGND